MYKKEYYMNIDVVKRDIPQKMILLDRRSLHFRMNLCHLIKIETKTIDTQHKYPQNVEYFCNIIATLLHVRKMF